MTRKELKDIHHALSDEQMEALIQYRGGCSCHMSPPCAAHEDLLTEEEAIDLGFIEIEGGDDDSDAG